MYTPGAFLIEDSETIRAIVRQNPFATLVTVSDGQPVASHLPFLLAEEAGEEFLVAHLAKANPQWRSFGESALVIFSGPHGYVSPRWYRSAPNVPTWNYLAVHAYGVPKIVEGEAAQRHLEAMVETFDPDLRTTHPESMEPDFLRKKLGGLVAFRMRVERWEAKAKLNQNKPEGDRLAVRERYLSSEDPFERAMAAYM